MSVWFLFIAAATAGPGAAGSVTGASAGCNANAVETACDISDGVVFVAANASGGGTCCGGVGGVGGSTCGVGGTFCCGGGGSTGGVFSNVIFSSLLASDTDAATSCDLFPRPRAVATAISADTGTDVSCGTDVSGAGFPCWVSSSDFFHRAIAFAADMSSSFVSGIGAGCGSGLGSFSRATTPGCCVFLVDSATTGGLPRVSATAV